MMFALFTNVPDLRQCNSTEMLERSILNHVAIFKFHSHICASRRLVPGCCNLHGKHVRVPPIRQPRELP